MIDFIKKLLAPFVGERNEDFLLPVGDIAQEANIGGQLFGKTASSSHQRQFFCLDESTWIWHESWSDFHGRKRSMTTTYEVRSHGIVKRFNQGGYTSLSNTEKNHFLRAVKLYKAYVGSYVYAQ